MPLKSHTAWLRPRNWAVVGMLLAYALCSWAIPVGEVEFARGVGFAQTGEQAPRILGKGLPLQQGDVLTTSDGALAIIKLQDGTRMTVRPNSQMVIQQYQFQADTPASNSMVMQLLQGGFRAITGLISKGSPDAAKVITKTATIGIRGTDFDARLCTTDCKAESSQIAEKPRANVVQASAKLVSAHGDVVAVDPASKSRHVVEGASLYPGDTVETAAGAGAVLAFRDESRMTLGASTRFRVDTFVFDAERPTEGRFLVSLLQGTLRALTGLVGKANHANVSFTTPTATIGIRGTGLDLDCATAGSCSFYTWLGSIEVTPQGQTALQVLQAGQGLYVSPTGMHPIKAPTLDHLPRPDTVPVNSKQLFGQGKVEEGHEGLFVFVRDGHIEIATASERLDLGKGETGFAGRDGSTVRPLTMPLFIEFDRTPMPNAKNPMLAGVLSSSGIHPVNQCR